MIWHIFLSPIEFSEKKGPLGGPLEQVHLNARKTKYYIKSFLKVGYKGEIGLSKISGKLNHVQ